MTDRKRILTGDRPTGKLHLGHYIGSHQHRLRFQDEYECFFLVADLHMLTTKPSKEDIELIGENARAIVMDHLAIGIDPEKVTFYLQSAVHEIYELQLLISSLVTVERLQQLPTIKDMASAANMDQMPVQPAGLSGLASRGYPHAPVAFGPRGQGQREPCGDHPADRPPLQQPVRRGLPRTGRLCAGRHPGGHGRPGQDEQEPEQRHLPQRRRQDRHQKGNGHVHGPRPHPGRHPRHGGGQPGLRLSRRLQPGQGPGGGLEGPLSHGQCGGCGGQGEAGRGPQRLPGPHAGAPGQIHRGHRLGGPTPGRRHGQGQRRSPGKPSSPSKKQWASPASGTA